MGLRPIASIVAISAWAGLAAGQAGDSADASDSAVIEIQEDSVETSAVSLETIYQKILDLEDRLRQLEEKLDTTMLAFTEIDNENMKLREALRVRYGRGGSELPPVPMPHKELIKSVLGEPVEQASEDADKFTIVRQWGRSPDTVAELSGNVSSLIGIAAVAAPGLLPIELEALGRELRQTYRSYDNINIRVFDDVTAAKVFADKGISSDVHLILSISKHRNSVSDSILRFENGHAIEVR